MRRATYNNLENARIKSIAVVLVILLINAILIYLLYRGIITHIYLLTALTFFYLGLGFLSRFVPFEQIIENTDNTNVMTYYLLGRFKFKLQTFGKLEKVILEQDDKKFYCIVIKLADGRNMTIERHPNLSNAEERKGTLTKIFE